MHPAGICTEQLAIEHKGKPRQRQPVSGVGGGKSPYNAARGQAVQNVLVFRYEEIIIVVDKTEIADLPEDQQSTQY